MKLSDTLSSWLGRSPAWVDALLARYDEQDAALATRGFPATSPWWRAQLERFLRSGRRRWVIRAGRRAGKSSTLCRLATCWALSGPWHVPPGDVAVIAFVSVDRDEAAARLRTIRDILSALTVSFDERGDELELRDRRLVFRVVTCSIRGTVGFTSVAVFGDEVARWEARDSAANPAREVTASLRPTLATQPLGFEVCSSSPWSVDDYHAELFDAGDTAHQCVSFAPTWVANPTITEEQTRELEPDERIWSREYAAVPGATITAALDPSDVARAFALRPSGKPRGGWLSIDASSLRGDAFTWLAGRTTDEGELVVCEAGGWEDAALRRVSMHDIVSGIASKATEFGTATVFGDQREEAALSALFQEHNVSLRSFAWSEPSKDDAMQLLRRLMRESKIAITCAHDRLRRELTGMKARLMPSGRTRYETNGLDYASALITAAHAQLAGEIGTHNFDPDFFARLAAQSERIRERNAGMGRWEGFTRDRGF